MIDILRLSLNFFWFLFFIFFFFYVPGNYILSFIKIKFEYPTNIFLSVITGIISFTMAMYIFSWLHIQLIIFAIIITIFFLSYKKNLFRYQIISKLHSKATIFTVILSLLFSFQMIFNGNFGNTIYYFGDDIAHLAYINELRFAFPPQHPGFAGVPLKGYHFFYDFLIAKISNTSFLSPLSLYFHFMPLLVAFGWGFGTYSLLYSWTKRISSVYWGVFLVLFGSSFGYILFFQHRHNGLLTSNFGIDQPNSALLNAPYSFSVVIVIATLILIHDYFVKRDKILFLLIALFVGISPIFWFFSNAFQVIVKKQNC